MNYFVIFAKVMKTFSEFVKRFFKNWALRGLSLYFMKKNLLDVFWNSLHVFNYMSNSWRM